MLAGVLLPTATVFLVLLCNDRPVLGPWVNSVRQNIGAWIIVWSLVLLSMALTAAVFFPNLPTITFDIGLAAGAGLGIPAGAVVIGVSRRSADRRDAQRVARELADLDPEQVGELADIAALTRAERKAIREADRANWRTPALATLHRPVMSPLRRLGLITLRGYLLLAIALAVVKLFETGLS